MWEKPYTRCFLWESVLKGNSVMAGFFSTDSKLYRFMSRLTDILKLNFLWLIFSLPIVTIGISTIAAYTVALKIAENQEGYIARDFLEAFAANWKQGIAMTFINAVCIWALWLDHQIVNAVEENSLIFLIIGIISAYVFVFSLLYVYPLLARYENTVMNCLKNSFHIGMKYFLRSVLLILILVFEAAVMFWTPTTLILVVLIGPAFMILTVSSFAIIIFRDLEKNPGTVAEKEVPAPEENSSEEDEP